MLICLSLPDFISKSLPKMNLSRYNSRKLVGKWAGTLAGTSFRNLGSVREICPAPFSLADVHQPASKTHSCERLVRGVPTGVIRVSLKHPTGQSTFGEKRTHVEAKADRIAGKDTNSWLPVEAWRVEVTSVQPLPDEPMAIWSPDVDCEFDAVLELCLADKPEQSG